MKFSIVFLLLILTVTSSCSKTDVYEEELTATTLLTSKKETELEIFEMVNNYRIERGLSILEYNQKAQAYTLEHNIYMISQNNVNHDNFVQRSSKLSVDINANVIAENVARNFISADSVFKAWLASEGHLKNIEGDFTATAISVYASNEGMLYFTQVFIK